MFDDDAFVNGDGDLGPFRDRKQGPLEILPVYLDIGKWTPSHASCQSLLEERHLFTLLPDRNLIPFSKRKRRLIDLATIHKNVAVHNHLPGSGNGRGKPDAIDDVVKTDFKKKISEGN